MNGYTTFDFNGDKLGLKFAMPAVSMIQAKATKMNKVPLVGDTYSIFYLAYTFWCGYYNNCMLKDIDEKYTVEQFNDYLEDRKFDPEFKEEAERIMNVYNDSVNTIIDDSKKKLEELKKKQTGKKSEKPVSVSD